MTRLDAPATTVTVFTFQKGFHTENHRIDGHLRTVTLETVKYCLFSGESTLNILIRPRTISGGVKHVRRLFRKKKRGSQAGLGLGKARPDPLPTLNMDELAPACRISLMFTGTSPP